jgi:predicted TIM-barrel fold metal-dependent hydrolase
MAEQKTASRRDFLAYGVQAGAALGAGTAASPACSAAPSQRSRPLVIDGMMHLEVYKSRTEGSYWESFLEEVLEHYEAAKIDKGVILTTWTPSRESNDRTLRAYEKHPDRFIPFGHVRPEDPDWQRELKRVSEPPWMGLKLHEGEIERAGDLRETTRTITRKAAELGIRIFKIHLVNYDILEELTRELSEVTWILPHMGCYGRWGDMQKYCELAKKRKNVYLDTSAVAHYWMFGKAFRWAGVDKITFASDGFMMSTIVEKAKIETLQLPSPYRTPRLTDEELARILGGNMARVLGIPPCTTETK